MSFKPVVKATVQLTLQVDLGSSWDARCSMEQIIESARKEAVNKILTKLGVGPFAVIGTPKVTVMTASEQGL